MDATFQQIGIIHSCFTEKFGIPRQSGLIPEAHAELEIFPPYNREEAFRRLETFSHIWILFIFHAIKTKEWKPCVRPPRLGGNQKIGVFASRSGFRPNRIGLSAVKLLAITKGDSCIKLMIQGGDFLDQTPVLDIKPYLPYADAIPSATGGFATERPKTKMKIEFSSKARSSCIEKEKQGYPGLCELIVQTLSSDPRPAYHSQRPLRKKFGVKLYHFNIKWEIMDDHILVSEIEDC
ncbi:MAG: tRNA (N6-threonylcarbamoyladenosine(37)-N6)-methyltransferase TrmO [Deltaproteobacteria bacterium]|nr:MAG: tRNA (N6-threonylcarbamoyladenosine(37)-N6)-methyltransferase TrmO [Deltaproteobacteria bacterium]